MNSASKKYLLAAITRIALVLILFVNIYWWQVTKMPIKSDRCPESFDTKKVMTTVSRKSHNVFDDIQLYYEIMQKVQPEIDSIMKSRERVIGNIAWHPSQIYYYAREASHDWIKNICEVGYGAGHSALLYLLVNPKASLYSFDIFAYIPDHESFITVDAMKLPRTFQTSTLKLIAQRRDFANRFHKITGDSNMTIPIFVRKNPKLKCDFISIDGSHVPPQPFFDILHLQPLAHNKTIVVLDDMQSSMMKNELTKAVKSKVLIEYECLKPEYRTDSRFASRAVSEKLFCSARYVQKGITQ